MEDLKDKLQNVLKCLNGEMTDNVTPEEQLKNIIKELETAKPVNVDLADVSKFDFNKFKEYVNTYDPKRNSGDNTKIIINDLIYGIGVSVSHNYRYLNGFVKFKEYLKQLF